MALVKHIVVLAWSGRHFVCCAMSTKCQCGISYV